MIYVSFAPKVELYKSFWHNHWQCKSSQRWASDAAGSGSDGRADAGSRCLHTVVRRGTPPEDHLLSAVKLRICVTAFLILNSRIARRGIGHRRVHQRIAKLLSYALSNVVGNAVVFT
jgi:hypothetical protein